MKDFRAATNYVCDAVEDLIDSKGNFTMGPSTFAESILQYSDLIETKYIPTESRNGELVDFPYHVLQPNVSDYLVALAYLDEGFFDYCLSICSRNIWANVPLELPLRHFASDVLTGTISRPTKRSRPRKRNWAEKSYFWRLTLNVVDEFGLTPTRNDEGSTRRSACDAVAEGLTVCGRKTSYSEIKNLMVHPDYAKLRSEFEAMQRIANRWRDVSKPEKSTAPNYRDFWSYAARADVMDILATFPPIKKKSN